MDKVYVLKTPSESNYDYDTEEGQTYIRVYQNLWKDVEEITSDVEFIRNN